MKNFKAFFWIFWVFWLAVGYQNCDQQFIGEFGPRTDASSAPSDINQREPELNEVDSVPPSTQTAVSTSPVWKQVLKRSLAQKNHKTLDYPNGLPGGEGWQMVFDLTYAPSNANIAYMAVDTTQVWKSIDGGKSWVPKGGGYPASGSSSIAVDPTNANVVYSAASVMGWWADQPNHVEGIMKSSDGGTSWTLQKKAHFHRNCSGKGRHFAFFGTTIYAAQCTGGLLKSTNGGLVWNLLASSSGGIVLDLLRSYNIAIHPTNGSTIFVSGHDGLYRVTDSGAVASALKIAGGLPVGPAYELQIVKSNPSRIYVAMGTSGVYGSTDGGVSFTTRNNGLSVPLGFGLSAQRLAISPVNPNRMMVSFSGKFGKYLYYTNDGGLSWTETRTMDELNPYGWVAGSTFGYTYDISGTCNANAPISFHPTNQDIALTGGWGCTQIKRTTDGGQTWKYSNNGFTGASAGTQGGSSAIAWDPAFPNRVAYSHIDFGSLISLDREDTFVAIMGITYKGVYATHAIAMRGSILVEAVGQGSGGEIAAVSRDLGKNWTYIIGTEAAEYKFIAFHPQNSNVVYAGKNKFTNIGTSNTFIQLPRPITAVFQGNGNVVYSNANTIYKSTDGGSTWTAPYPSLNLPSGYYVYNIAVDPFDQNRIYAAVRGKGVFIITNTLAAGGTVLLRNELNGLAKDQFGEVNPMSVAVDPVNSNIVYAANYAGWAGQSNGIFRSVDRGLSWTNVNANLGKYLNIHNVIVSPIDRYVYANGPMGTWKLPPP